MLWIPKKQISYTADNVALVHIVVKDIYFSPQKIVHF